MKLFDCTCIGDVIKFLIDGKKEVISHYSISLMAKKMGLQGHSSLSAVMSNKRPFPKKSFQFLQKEFDLNDSELKFIELLNKKFSASDKGELEHIEEQIKELIDDWRMKFSSNSVDDLFKTPLYGYIFTLLSMRDAKCSALWLRKQLGNYYSTSEIQDALDNLIQWNIIEIDQKESKFTLSFENVRSSRNVSEDIIRRGQFEAIALAKQKQENKELDRSNSLFMGMSYLVPRESFSQLYDDLNKAIIQVIERYETPEREKCDSARHIQVIDFPLGN